MHENANEVFVVTGLFSFFAYIWLLLILRYNTPDVVSVWEASVTFILFPILIIFAYVTDQNYFGFLKSLDVHRQMELGVVNGEQNGKINVQKNLIKKDGEIDKENLIQFVKEAKKFPNLKDEEIALLAATKLLESTSHSSNWYRIDSLRSATGSKKVKPVLSSRLKQVYEIIKNHPDGLKLNDIPKDFLDPEKPSVSIVEFHSSNVAVKEDIGQFYVTICRYGNLHDEVKVRVDSFDGSAKQGEDYVAVKEFITFAPYEQEKNVISISNSRIDTGGVPDFKKANKKISKCRKRAKEKNRIKDVGPFGSDTLHQIAVKIIDDNKWEPDEEFFLRLTLVGKRNENVKLGQFPIMEVTIIDDDEPGIIMFQKRGLVVKESSGVVSVPIVRLRGADGTVTAKWKTVDKSAISGRDYLGGEGEIVFKHNEIQQNLKITIVDDLNPEKDEYFEIVLFEPTGGAKIGYINRILITISNDDDFNSVAHRLMVLTGANLDALKVHTETWAEQFKQAMTINGGDLTNAHVVDYVLHFFSFFWKVLFAFIPPVAIFNGWLCFFVCLCVIGFMTTIIGDLATIFGCLIYLDDTITAITIVALGTTLPDILGARMVTRAEEHADGALIHISGSIAINVLLGVGVPWFVAACYHKQRGTTFEVKSRGLDFSVLMFSIASVLAALLLVIRRKLPQFGRAELGGPTNMRYVTVAILVTLWLLYLLFSSLQIANVINPSFLG